MEHYMIFVVVYIVCSVLWISVCESRMDCAQNYFDGGSTKSGKLYCGRGFHECGDYGDACCNDIEASPVQLVLVILGPATVISSLVLVGFVLKTIISTIKEDRLVDTTHHHHSAFRE